MKKWFLFLRILVAFLVGWAVGVTEQYIKIRAWERELERIRSGEGH